MPTDTVGVVRDLAGVRDLILIDTLGVKLLDREQREIADIYSLPAEEVASRTFANPKKFIRDLFERTQAEVTEVGPAGLTYAAAVSRNNQVTLFERAEHSGGSLLMAGLAPKFQGVEAEPSSLRRFIRSLEEICLERGVTFHFTANPEIDPSLLDNFDLVVLATGAAYRWKLAPRSLGRYAGVFCICPSYALWPRPHGSGSGFITRRDDQRRQN